MSNAVKTQTKTTKATKTTKVELSEAGVKALTAFNKAKAAEAKAKVLKAKAEAMLRAELGEATEATVQGVVAVKVISSKTSSFDRKALLDLYPEAYGATYRETEYDYLKTL